MLCTAAAGVVNTTVTLVSWRNHGRVFLKLQWFQLLNFGVSTHEIQPRAWELSLMQPIYKGGNKLKTDPASYRGIYLSSALAKLLEGLLLHRLTQYTEAHDTLTPNQLGTRPGRQAHDAIYSLLAIIQRNWTLDIIRASG